MDWTKQKIILASQSPRRREILKMVGLDFTVQKSAYIENNIEGKLPLDLVKIHALGKAQDVAKELTDGLVIGADTIVVVQTEILGKPKDKSEAFHMLKKLSGKTHEVQTGVAIVNAANSHSITFAETTAVTFTHLPDEIIQHYLNHYHYSDKAGSYAIQDYSGLFVEKISGCFYNVVGFPVAHFYKFMNQNQSKLL